MKRQRPDDWCTPPEIFDPLMEEFNFDLDAAATEETAKLPKYISDSLSQEQWPGLKIWLNPPYGHMLEKFVRRACREARYGKTIVALIPFRCRAAWWHECVIGKALEVRCVRKRISFMRPDGSRGKYVGSCDSCIVIWQGWYKETKLTSWSGL